MKILMIHNEYARPSGEEEAVAALTALLTQNGHQVETYFRSSAEIVTGADRIKALLSGFHNAKSVREIEAKLDSYRPDLVQVQNLYPLISPSILPVIRKRNIPIVMRCPNYRIFCPNGLHLNRGSVCERCLHGLRELNCILYNCCEQRAKSIGYALRNMWARFTGKILKHVNMFIVQSEFQRQRFIANGISAEKLAVLPNMPPLVVDADTPALGTGVAFVGRVSHEKGILEFIEAARLLPKIPFIVAGDDSDYPSLRQQSPANLHWRGFLDQVALNRLYQEARIFVFPSKWYEGFPNVITRAMQAKKPVIASRIGALPEIVDDGSTGLLCEPGNAMNLARCIESLYCDPKSCHEMGLAGYEKVQRCYTPQTIYTQLIEIYKRASAALHPTSV